ncbi:MBL fold metallo-hydrolase [Shewanella avicenniae]|uniref:MBL fold metallo-hydrolase n=1 Tax=Shewanella avicenniae TaxID=2814294 RepID=A0ABX7QRF9_9GAMM|nr:MBL fold metallo-hydrolase [Shewanella avicenniae]QSX34049.1 MBL fold metallo-hydrolase [Shewanella avicenniae]
MLSLNRTLCALLLSTALLQAPLSYAETQLINQQAGGYQLQVGDVVVTALNDGTVPQDAKKLLRNISQADIDNQLAHNFQHNPVEGSINAYLIQLPQHTVLVDTGAGHMFGPDKGGKVLADLATFGIKAEDITDILLTHSHADHTGGLIANGQRVFPNATVHLGKGDIDFFFDDAKMKSSQYGQGYFDGARNTLKPYIDANKVKTFSGSEQILPNITATEHPGHTPGSAFYRLESQGKSITFIGDIIHIASVQFAHPNVTIIYDQDQSQAKAVRNTAFDQFVKEGELVAGPHLSFPGIGHLRQRGDGYEWVPVDYVNRKPSAAK